MNRFFKKEAYSGFKATPIIATLTFICGLCLFLQHTIDPDMNSTLTCNSDVYRVGEGVKGSQELVLKNTSQGVEVSLSFLNREKVTHTIMVKGTVKQLKDSILTYEVRLADGQYLKDSLQADNEKAIKDAFKLAELVLGDSKSETFLVKVLEMNKAAKVVTVQIDPGNGLWACKIN